MIPVVSTSLNDRFPHAAESPNRRIAYFPSIFSIAPFSCGVRVSIELSAD